MISARWWCEAVPVQYSEMVKKTMMTALQLLFVSAGALVFFVPMNFLAFYTAVQGVVPTAEVDCFYFTVVAPVHLNYQSSTFLVL